MSLLDYLFPLLLIFSVVRQVRGRRLSLFQLLWPVGLVILAAVKYLHGFPLKGNDLVLVAAVTVTGLVLGIFAGALTRVYRQPDGTLMARATVATIVLWVLGTVGRLVFGLYAQHGGGPAIASFSHSHDIAISAWGPALVLMVLCEVAGRTLMLAARALRADPGHPADGGHALRDDPRHLSAPAVWRES